MSWQDENGNWVVCCVKGCDREPQSLGLCLNHHRLNVKYGSPVANRMAPWRWLALSFEERFWRNVRKGETCWLWHGSKDRDGYGIFRGEVEGIVYTKAHRFSFALHNGPVVPGLSVCHRCDVPDCVNPDHLFAGTTLMNMRDKIAKGRARVPFGEGHFNALLTEEQARTILTDPRPYVVIAAEYGVAPSTINSLKNRVSWPHLGGAKGAKAPRVSPRKGVSDRITPEIVREIRASKERGDDLAARFGVSKQTICGIRKGRGWAHVDGVAPDTKDHRAKITEATVREIRASTERGVDIAARLGVAKATITDIRKRRNWAHIE